MVECAGKRILIDCGLHQGSRELDEENSQPFGFDPASIDYVLLTHAHLDHCGRVPLLAKRNVSRRNHHDGGIARVGALGTARCSPSPGGRCPLPSTYCRATRFNGSTHSTALFDPRCFAFFRPLRTNGGLRCADRARRWRARHLHQRWSHPGFGQHQSAAYRRGATIHRVILRGSRKPRRPVAIRSREAAGRRQRGDGNHVRRPVAQALGTVH